MILQIRMLTDERVPFGSLRRRGFRSRCDVLVSGISPVELIALGQQVIEVDQQGADRQLDWPVSLQRYHLLVIAGGDGSARA